MPWISRTVAIILYLGRARNVCSLCLNAFSRERAVFTLFIAFHDVFVIYINVLTQTLLSSF